MEKEWGLEWSLEWDGDCTISSFEESSFLSALAFCPSFLTMGLAPSLDCADVPIAEDVSVGVSVGERGVEEGAGGNSSSGTIVCGQRRKMVISPYPGGCSGGSIKPP